jgi:hypothetical protein
MLIGRILSGTAHQALTCMRVSHFPKIPRRRPATPQAKHRPMPFARHSRLLVPTRPRLRRGMRPYGRAGRAGRRLLKRREWRFLTGRCCCSPVLSTHSETHQLWLGTGLRQASHKNRTSCGRRIKPGVWPVRSTRRSSSPWVVPGRLPGLWLKPCRVLSGECVTGNRLRCTATRPSPSICTAPGVQVPPGDAGGGRPTLGGDVTVGEPTVVVIGAGVRVLPCTPGTAPQHVRADTKLNGQGEP